MYYHTLIETKEKIGKNQTNRQYFELDKLNLDEIENDIVIPYLEENKFHFNGYFLHPNDIIRVVIKTTEKTSKEYSKYENDNMPRGVIHYVNPQDIISYESYDKYTNDITKEVFSNAKKKINIEQIAINITKPKTTNLNNVFIVHGHNTEVKLHVARTLEKLGLNPIILHEQANKGKTIIEKFEDNANVGFAVILLTGDDLGKAMNDEKLNHRARQNVILELGYFIGKLGRNRVCTLYTKDVELPSDLYGLLYVEIDKNEYWKISLVKELKSAGYNIDVNNII